MGHYNDDGSLTMGHYNGFKDRRRLHSRRRRRRRRHYYPRRPLRRPPRRRLRSNRPLRRPGHTAAARAVIRAALHTAFVWLSQLQLANTCI